MKTKKQSPGDLAALVGSGESAAPFRAGVFFCLDLLDVSGPIPQTFWILPMFSLAFLFRMQKTSMKSKQMTTLSSPNAMKSAMSEVQSKLLWSPKEMAKPGLEPGTPAFSVQCSTN